MKQTTNTSPDGVSTRREFIKKSTIAVAAVAAGQNLLKTPVYGQNQAPSPPGAVGANNRLVVGYIGVGLQGTAHLKLQQQNAAANNIVQAAAADLSKTRQAEAKATMGGAAESYEDYRKLLDRKDIDAVTIATTDPWHANAAIDALQAGKHVYGEKPLARYLGDAFKIYDTVKNTGKVFQIGSQGTSDAKWAKAAELIKGGKYGALVLGQDSYMRNSKKGEWNNPIASWAKADDINWDEWQKLVHDKTPFDAEAYFCWRKYYRYCAGPLGDLCPHRMHPLMMATGNPEFPSRVVCLGQQPVRADLDPDYNKPPAPLRDCPEDLQLIAEFPSGLSLMMVSGTVNEYGLESVIRLHKATILMTGNRVEVRPEIKFADDDGMDPMTIDNIQPGEDIATHEKNWFDSIRLNQPANANGNIDLAIKVQTVLSLAEMSNRMNMVCLFDEKTRTITNGDGKVIPAITFGTLAKS